MKKLSQVNATETVVLVKAQHEPHVVTVYSQKAADMQGRLVFPGLLLSGLVRVERWP